MKTRNPGKGRFLLLVGLLIVQAASVQSNSNSTHEELSAAIDLVGDNWPVDTGTRLTTAGDIYMNNLNGQLRALYRRYQRHGQDSDLARIALLRYHRFQVLGHVEDAEVARDMLASEIKRPHDADIDLALVQVLVGFHDFAQASALLDTVENTGKHAKDVKKWHERIARMTKPGNMQQESPGTPDGHADPVALVMAADRARQQGQLELAGRLLRQAQDNYIDTSPFLLAWIHTQQGIQFLEQDAIVEANRFFRAAHERFPQYALAWEHLAETELTLGNHARALQLYQGVYAQTRHPEFLYQQSVAERALGMTAKADQHAKQARSEYLELTNRYPLMYADHAANYFLETGDITRARSLALQNYTARKDNSALALLEDVGCKPVISGVPTTSPTCH